MGGPHIDSLIHIAVIPGAITGFTLGYLRHEYDLSSVTMILLTIPLWAGFLAAWVLGLGGIAWLIEFTFRRRFRHPPCPHCSGPLATQHAQQCLHCGADWHGTVQ